MYMLTLERTDTKPLNGNERTTAGREAKEFYNFPCWIGCHVCDWSR